MYYWFWGMNLWWWFFWVMLIVLFFSLMVPVSRTRFRSYDNPLSILARRYAAGEISTEEYEERRARLEKDVSDSNGRRVEDRRIDRHQPA